MMRTIPMPSKQKLPEGPAGTWSRNRAATGATRGARR